MSSPTVVPSPDEWMYETDRLYLSRHSSGPLIVRATGPYGDPMVPDGPVTLTMTPQFTVADGDPVPGGIYAAAKVPDTVADYEVVLASADTSIPGPYLARWTYVVGGVERIGEQPLMVGGSAPAYDSLPLAWKQVVESVWLRVADMFDSPMGGPHLQVYMQAHFGRNRIAQLLGVAIGRLNTVSQPVLDYGIGDHRFPLAKWGSLLGQALWVETIKHLQRSYMEQPNPIGVTVARMDRSTYASLWGQLLAQETADLRSMLDNFKMQHMNLGGGSILVAGGIYPTVPSHSASMMTMAAPRGVYLVR